MLPEERTIIVQRTDFGTLAGEWEALLGLSTIRNIFLTPQWQELCWQNLQASGWQLLLLAVRSEGGAIGIAPLRRREGTISFIGNVEVSDHLDFVLRGGDEEAFYQAFLEALQGEDWHTLDLHCLPPASPTLAHLPALAERLGFSVALELEEVSPAMELPDTWDGFLNSLDKKHRHELRRKMRRLQENDSFRFYSVVGAELSEAMDDFLRLHRVSTLEKAAFMDRSMEAFFRAMAARLAAQDWVRLYFLEVEGKRVSAVLCFEYGDELLLYNSGFDPAYSSLSVGLLLKAFCISDAIERGKKRFDFLRGNEHYKYQLGGVDVPLYRCLVRRPSHV